MNFLRKIKSLFIKEVEVIKEIPVEKKVEVVKEVPVEVVRYVEKPVEIITEIEKPVEVVKEVVVEKPVEVIREIEVENQAFDLVDNLELLTKDKIIQLVKSSDRLDIATGYFYHHGYNLFADSVEELVEKSRSVPTDVPARIIVGNLGIEDEIDKTTAKLVWRFIQDKDSGIAIKTIKDRRLHTKLYLGHNEKETSILFGSSNVSYAGLIENIELNTIETVPYDSKRATLFREWFENLWQIADEIDAELLQKIIEAVAEEEEVLVLDDYTLRALLLSIRFLRETSKENLFYYQYEDAISVLERYNLGPKYTGVMLAHEVGLGKTIITAKVIKTLMEKGALKKSLIATPASLCEQWQGELEDEKFGLSFEILDGQRLKNAKSNLFQELDHIIVSIDFLKNQIDKCQIADIDWDLLVIDESHYLRNKDSQRFKEIKNLFYSAYFKMLLTATPIQNKDLDIFVQLSLIDESIKTLTEKGVEDLDFESLKERNIIRRLRSDIREFERIIPQRVVHPSNYIPLDESLRELYQKFQQFITQDCAYYPLIQELVSGFGYIVPFIQFVYLQQLCSSMGAFTASVRRLKDTIGEIIDSGSVGINIQKYQQDFDGTDEAFNEFVEQYGEEQLERRGSKLYLKIRLSDERVKNLKPDRVFLEEILQEAEAIESIPKRSEFLTLCEDIIARGEKAVVFVKYEPTGKQLTQLVSQISHDGHPVQTAFFHGGLSKNERRELKNRLNSFTRDDKIDILIATDAGGVGLNLQGANNIINYDSAWNPMVVEQRIGRVHRIGQRRTVHVYNLFSSFGLKNEGVNDDNLTVDEHINQILEVKLKNIATRLGMSDKVISETVVSSADFIRIVMKRVTQTISQEEYEKEMEQLIEGSAQSAQKLEHLKIEQRVEDAQMTQSKADFMIDALEKVTADVLQREGIAYEIPEEHQFLIRSSSTLYHFFEGQRLTSDAVTAARHEDEIDYILASDMIENIYENYLKAGFGDSGAKEIVLNEINDDNPYAVQRKLLASYSGKTGVQYNCILNYKIVKDGRENEEQELIPFLVCEDEANRDENLNRYLNLLPSKEIEIKYASAIFQATRPKIEREMRNIAQAKRDSIQSRIEEYQGDIFEENVKKLIGELEKLDEERAKLTKRQERYQRQAKYSQGEETQKEIDKIDRQYKSKKSQLDEMKKITGATIIETKPQILDVEWRVDSKCIVKII